MRKTARIPLNSIEMAGHLTFANFKVRAPKLKLPVASYQLSVTGCQLLVGS
jgi:hypothetical protein